MRKWRSASEFDHANARIHLVDTKEFGHRFPTGLSKVDFPVVWRCLQVLPNVFGLRARTGAAARRRGWFGSDDLANYSL